MQRARTFCRIVIPVVAVVTTSVCQQFFEADPDSPLDPLAMGGHLVSKLIKMENASSTAVHLFSEEQTFPCCQVEPGGSRDALFRFFITAGDAPDEKETAKFRAGRNGAIIFTRECVTTQAKVVSSVPLRVVFTEDALSCPGW